MAVTRLHDRICFLGSNLRCSNCQGTCHAVFVSSARRYMTEAHHSSERASGCPEPDAKQEPAHSNTCSRLHFRILQGSAASMKMPKSNLPPPSDFMLSSSNDRNAGYVQCCSFNLCSPLDPCDDRTSMRTTSHSGSIQQCWRSMCSNCKARLM